MTHSRPPLTPFEPIINSVETCLPPAALTKYRRATRLATYRPMVIAAAKKELAEAKEVLLKKEVESGASGRGRSGSRNETRGDSMERLREKERIKLDAFELKSAIVRKNKEKEEKKAEVAVAVAATAGEEGVVVGVVVGKVAVAVAATAREEGVVVRVVAAGVAAAAREGGVATGVIAAAAAVGAGGKILGVVVVPVAAVAAAGLEEGIVGVVPTVAAAVTVGRGGGIVVPATAAAIETIHC